MQISEQVNDIITQSVTLCDLGNIYKKEKSIERALDCFDKSIRLLEEVGYKYFLCDSLFCKAELLFDLNKFELSMELNERAAKIANQVGNKEILSKTKILKQRLERC